MRFLNEQVAIAAPPADVWAALEDFGGVAKWAPNMRRSKLVGSLATGNGARRIMHHHLGFNFEEVITHWDEGEGYSFEVYRAPYPMRHVHENWTLLPKDGQSLVRTQVSYDMSLGFPGKWLDSLLVRHIVRREMRSGLRGLKRYVEGSISRPNNVSSAS